MNLAAQANSPPVADVLIAGFGPTGAALAALLGLRGWKVVVVEREPFIYDKPRAITADQEAFRILQEIGIADEVFETTTPHPGTDFVGLEGQVIKRFYPAPPPHALGWTPNWMFLQPQLEASMRKAVGGMPNVQALLGHELRDVVQDDDRVHARLVRLEDASESALDARYLLAADGASSVVRKEALPQIEDLAFDEWWIVVDAWIRRPVDLPERCVQYCRPSRPGTYIVGPGALRRWEIKILPHESPQAFEDHDRVWSVLSEFVDTSALEHCRTAVYRFHALVAQSWRDRRVFLAGDAAHQMPPFLGQGLCAGLRDAHNLAWKLNAVMRGQWTQDLLDTYAEERKQHVRTVVAHAKSFGLIIGELDPAAARARDQRLEEDLRSGRAETVRQRFIPGLQAGLIARDAQGAPLAGAGELLVQPWVRQRGGAWQRLDDAVGADWVVIARQAAVLDALEEPVRDRWRRLAGRLVVVAEAGDVGHRSTANVLWLEAREDLLDPWFSKHGAVALLARPDRYIFGAAASAAALEALVLQVITAAAAGAPR